MSRSLTAKKKSSSASTAKSSSASIKRPTPRRGERWYARPLDRPTREPCPYQVQVVSCRRGVVTFFRAYPQWVKEELLTAPLSEFHARWEHYHERYDDSNPRLLVLKPVRPRR